ncbi:MAG: UDP-N-acetylglucosamine 2-epimerase (non-hydrolyzing) [Gammaproteobacteria bacterium]|nr:UDP-N-acetylglucosamine 2-epimerase (non-hydrolyzing) [Gammaproteobacteria bacterium]
MKTILCIIGTRPEVIKMAPVILALKKEAWANVRILITAQHRELLDQMMEIFGLSADIDLNIMTENQKLPELTSRLISKLDQLYQAEKPELVIAQGDTTTVFTAALLSFYYQIPFGHVEAGLRTHNIYYPFPEEANRRLVAPLAHFNFAPTETAKKALQQENISEETIFVTGNTVIDSLHMMLKQKPMHDLALDKNKKLILVTAHRRENFGDRFLNICRALKKIVDETEDTQIVYPVHPNPNVYDIAHRELGNHPKIFLTKPLDYLPFLALMSECYCLLTDSGGIQEEGPALGKPVLVLRDETERPEAVEAGVVKLVGTKTENIFHEAQKLLTDKKYYQSIAKGVSPYGDGHAAERIVAILKKALT